MNHEHYEQRLDFVKSILQLNGLEAESIEPLEYDPNGPFPYNNFVYLVTLSKPTTTSIRLRSCQSHDGGSRPGTTALPANSQSLVFRLANHNPGTGLNNTNRVENEVAFMTLVRQALAGSKYNHIVPDIYAWTSNSTGQSFTAQQHMPGTMPDRAFNDLALEDRSIILGQMTDILSLIQRFKIPETVDKFGGLKFDESGNRISAQMSLYKGEPSATYLDFLRTVFQNKLDEADQNPVIQGWRDNGVRTKLDSFLGEGLGEIVTEIQDVRKTLVHSDLTTNNLLFDRDTLQVTALLDFDFAYVATAMEEFSGFSFGNLSGGILPGPFEGGPMAELRDAMLTGLFPESLPVGTSSEVDWEVAKSWNNELTRAGAERPCTIAQFREISDIYWLAEKISPFDLDNPAMRKRKTAEQLKEARENYETLILQFLNTRGQNSKS